MNAAFGAKLGLEDQHINSGAPLFVPVYATDGQANAAFSENLALTLTSHNEQPYIAQPIDKAVSYGIPGNWIGRAPENGGNAVEPMVEVSPCQTKTDRHAVAQQMAVRRLTPVECERLQGFPDGWTDIQLNGKPTPDGPRYKALGNSMAVNVMTWIGERIQMVVDSRKEIAA